MSSNWSYFRLFAYPVKASFPTPDGSIPDRLVRVDMIRKKSRVQPESHSVIVSVRNPTTNKVQFRDTMQLNLAPPQHVVIEWSDGDAFTLVFSGEIRRSYRRNIKQDIWNRSE